MDPISLGTPVNHTFHNDTSPIHQLSISDRPDLLLKAIQNGADVNQTVHHETSLMWAVSKGKQENVRILIAAGANIHYTNHRGDSAIARGLKV